MINNGILILIKLYLKINDESLSIINQVDNNSNGLINNNSIQYNYK